MQHSHDWCLMSNNTLFKGSSEMTAKSVFRGKYFLSKLLAFPFLPLY